MTNTIQRFLATSALAFGLAVSAVPANAYVDRTDTDEAVPCEPADPIKSALRPELTTAL